jgi:hypothetical protein
MRPPYCFLVTSSEAGLEIAAKMLVALRRASPGTETAGAAIRKAQKRANNNAKPASKTRTISSAIAYPLRGPQLGINIWVGYAAGLLAVCTKLHSFQEKPEGTKATNLSAVFL